MRVVQSVPNFVSGCDPKFADVSTLAELLSLPWVKSWEDGMRGKRFIGWRKSPARGSETRSLMALYGDDESGWWVVAHVPNVLVADLPEWEISPAGCDRVARWNAGDWNA